MDGVGWRWIRSSDMVHHGSRAASYGPCHVNAVSVSAFDTGSSTRHGTNLEISDTASPILGWSNPDLNLHSSIQSQSDPQVVSSKCRRTLTP